MESSDTSDNLLATTPASRCDLIGSVGESLIREGLSTNEKLRRELMARTKTPPLLNKSPQQPTLEERTGATLKRVRGRAPAIQRYEARPIGERKPKLNYTFGFSEMTNMGRENRRVSDRMCDIRHGGVGGQPMHCHTFA